MIERTFEDLAEAMQRARDYGRRCTLLMGAGCSVTAHIPSASEIAEEMRRSAPRVYERARQAADGNEPTYSRCMAQLTAGERADLLARYIAGSRINTAHLAVAALMKQGVLSRVLTTNFDPLLVRACALLHLFPAIYDLSASQTLPSAAGLSQPAIFYLHGQGNCLNISQDDPACRGRAEDMASLLNTDGSEQLLLVSGYSGENDPFFPHFLSPLARFRYGIYWAAYPNREPASAVTDTLRSLPQHAFLLRSYDADTLLGGLAQRLQCIHPDLFNDPFTVLTDAITPLLSHAVACSFAHSGTSVAGNGSAHPSAPVLPPVMQAASAPRDSESRRQVAGDLLLQGDYDKLISLWYETEEAERSGLREAVSWAYVAKGNALFQQAQQMEPREKSAFLLTQASMQYQTALDIHPDRHQALYSWGSALLMQARIVVGTDRYRLLSEAEEKFLELEAYRPGIGLYPLARISALRGDDAAARRWLLLWKQFGGPPDPEEAALDTDFHGLSGDNWFRPLNPAGEKEDLPAANGFHEREVLA